MLITLLRERFFACHSMPVSPAFAATLLMLKRRLRCQLRAIFALHLLRHAAIAAMPLADSDYLC